MPRNKIKKGKTFLKGNFGDRTKEDFETPEDIKSAIKARYGDYFDPCPPYSSLPLLIHLYGRC